MAAAVGVDFVSFPDRHALAGAGRTRGLDGRRRRSARKSCEANPRALLLPRFGADPPDWWRKAHPDEVMTWEDGSRQHHAVVASPLYRREAAARVAALVEHLESKFGDHMAGYHPCGQNTGEWFYQDTWEKLLNGYAPADTNAWRAWLRARYRNDAAAPGRVARPGGDSGQRGGASPCPAPRLAERHPARPGDREAAH